MAPSPLAIVHLVENRVPHVGFHVGAVIFVETVAGAAVAGTYLKCLTYFKITCELVFVFVGFSGDDLRFGPVYWLLANFLVLGDARVMPVAGFRCFSVLFSTYGYGPDRLPYILGFFRAWALELIHSWFEKRVVLGLVTTAENILQFCP